MSTHTSALLTFRSGATATLLTSYDSGVRRNQREFYGPAATLQVPDPNHFSGDRIVTDLFDDPQMIPSRTST
ncbi:hypothetical protein F6B42_01325 [Microbacterium radiodurans]|uniref:Uncharacterized protein n=1 Tax=Microbacterium radiodurans TaxID=661398 RepID=A0A5J5IUA4_9MICO|nr:hypothetical protein F6B42_01325 [Microbacterium radiodurans]